MSWVSGPDGVLDSGWLSSAYAGLGIPGSAIPSSGDSGPSPVVNDGINVNREYYWKITAYPSAGTLVPYEDLTFEFSGAPDGTYSFVYPLFEDGVSQGTATVTMQVGNPSALFNAISGGIVGSMSAGSLGPTAQTHLTLASPVFSGSAKVKQITLISAVTGVSVGAMNARAGSKALFTAVTGSVAAQFAADGGSVIGDIAMIDPRYVIKRKQRNYTIA